MELDYGEVVFSSFFFSLLGRQRQTRSGRGLFGGLPHEERHRDRPQFGKRRRRRERRGELQPVLGAFPVGPQLTGGRRPLPASVHGLGGVSDRERNGQHAQQQQLQLRSDPLAELPVGRPQPELPVPTALTSTWLGVFVVLFLVFPVADWPGGGSVAGPLGRERLSPW